MARGRVGTLCTAWPHRPRRHLSTQLAPPGPGASRRAWADAKRSCFNKQPSMVCPAQHLSLQLPLPSDKQQEEGPVTPAWRLRAGSAGAHRVAWPPCPRCREDAGLGLPSPVPAEPWSHGTASQPHRCLGPAHRISRPDTGSARRGKLCDLRGLFSPDLLGVYAAHPVRKRRLGGCRPRLGLRSSSPSHLVTRVPVYPEKVEERTWPCARAEHHPSEPFATDQVAFQGCQVSEIKTQDVQLNWNFNDKYTSYFFVEVCAFPYETAIR